MILQEPRLLELQKAGQRVRKTLANYESLKRRLNGLVGMHSAQPNQLLRSARAWDIAHSKILGRW
jgi:hypothetical protein